MFIIHGENTTQSRQALFELIQRAKSTEREVVRLDAKTLDLPKLEQQLGSTSLFGTEQFVVIEELHSLPKSQRQSALLKYLAESAAQNPDLVLWEKRQLTPTMLKPFATAKVQHFPVNKVVFQWLDSLSGTQETNAQQRTLKLFHQAATSDGAGMCFAMLCRQVRLLLEVTEGKSSSLPAFILNKARSQARSFTLERLLKLHTLLLQIDIGQKTSTNQLNFDRELELFLLRM